VWTRGGGDALLLDRRIDMTTIQEMREQVGKRVRFTGTHEPDPELNVGDEGVVEEIRAIPHTTPRVMVVWDSGLRAFLCPWIDYWEVIPPSQ
jgi:hypothetical protein